MGVQLPLFLFLAGLLAMPVPSYAKKPVPKDGIGIQRYKSGKVAGKFTFKNGKKNGPFETYYEDGQLKRRGSFKDGQEDGPFEKYHENGQLEHKVPSRREGTRPL